MINKIIGDQVNPLATHPKHFGELTGAQPVQGDFIKEMGTSLKNVINQANDLAIDSESLSIQMIQRPDSVSIHEVMIAGQKAQLALELTKGIMTRAVQAYQAITNLR